MTESCKFKGRIARNYKFDHRISSSKSTKNSENSDCEKKSIFAIRWTAALTITQEKRSDI